MVNDIRAAYLISKENLPVVELTLLVNNIFNKLYESKWLCI